MAERQLPKLNVAGSIPVSRSSRIIPASTVYFHQRIAHLSETSASTSLATTTKPALRGLCLSNDGSVLVRRDGIILLGQLQVLLQRLCRRNVCNRLGDLGVPFGPHLQALQLAKLRGEQLALDA